MLPSGTVLQNRYRVLRELGHGGMGTVYEALDQRVSCIVALKETSVGDNREARSAFEREAALLANLRHSALPKVMDYFSESDGDFLVMEFIPGYDLAELLELRESPFPQSQVLRWADKLLEVLDYLHRQQPPILHRDIKPSNLKLTKQGEIFLLDFGLAKGTVGQMSTAMASRSVRGYTPVYAALEQIHGHGTDPRSDLYSLGATLYHLLTATPPIDAPARFSALEDEIPDPLPDIKTINSQCTSSVAGIIHQAMEVNRRVRPASALDMRKALRLAGEEDERGAAEEEYRRAEAKRVKREVERHKAEQEAARRAEAEAARRAEEEAARRAEAEAARQAEAENAQRAEEERLRLELEAKRIAEAERLAAEEAAKLAEKERKRLALEARRLRKEAKEREAAQRAAEEAARLAEEARLQRELEVRRLQEEAHLREVERLKAEEAARIAEEERRQREVEVRRLQEEARQRELERAAAEEAARVAEEEGQRRELEVRRLQEEAHQRTLESLAAEEAARLAEEERRRREIEAQQMQEEARLQENDRRKAAEAARLAAEERQRKVLEEARRRSEARHKKKNQGSRTEAAAPPTQPLPRSEDLETQPVILDAFTTAEEPGGAPVYTLPDELPGLGPLTLADSPGARELQVEIAVSGGIIPSATVPDVVVPNWAAPVNEPEKPVESRESLPGSRHTKTAATEASDSGIGMDSLLNYEAPREKARRTLMLVIAIPLGVIFIAAVAWIWQSGLREKPVAPGPPQPPSGMTYVASGSFTMGRDGGDPAERPAHPVAVKPFFIDLYEVTNQDYLKFVEATGYQAPATWGGKYAVDSALKPVTGVNWDDARAYAKWANKRLPTEEEWEFAARGSDGRVYPWGNSWQPNGANAGGASRDLAIGGFYKATSPVGAFDMVGNAWEWTASDMRPYPGGTLPANLTGANLKVIRGGSYESANDSATATYRTGWPASGARTYAQTGFRCAADVGP